MLLGVGGIAGKVTYGTTTNYVYTSTSFNWGLVLLRNVAGNKVGAYVVSSGLGVTKIVENPSVIVSIDTYNRIKVESTDSTEYNVLIISIPA